MDWLIIKSVASASQIKFVGDFAPVELLEEKEEPEDTVVKVEQESGLKNDVITGNPVISMAQSHDSKSYAFALKTNHKQLNLSKRTSF